MLHDAGAGLNRALHLAREHARAAHARELVLLPADLPQVDARIVEALIEAGRRGGIAIAPDRGGTGTNGFTSPATSTSPVASACAVSARTWRRRGDSASSTALVVRPGLATDLDTPRRPARGSDTGGLPVAPGAGPRASLDMSSCRSIERSAGAMRRGLAALATPTR